MGLLDGRVAVVTGSGRGIGFEIARLFGAEGALLCLHYRSSADGVRELGATLGSDRWVEFQADLTKPVEAEALIDCAVAKFGKLDILVNDAASFSHPVPFETSTLAQFQTEWDGVFGPTFNCCRAAVGVMKSANYGRIVNLGATLLQRPAAGLGAHTCAKAAVIALTRQLATEYGPYNILVNAVSPGMTLTQYSLSLPESQRSEIGRKTPLRRVAQPLDVARVVLFYASDLASFVTGSTLFADGGLAT